MLIGLISEFVLREHLTNPNSDRKYEILPLLFYVYYSFPIPGLIHQISMVPLPESKHLDH